ncbi:hypothetical protein GCM10010335_68330 [Streptomyces galbus]|nr:hypothetical protein GCM10010335_68330 [Streptomyces galbus]
MYGPHWLKEAPAVGVGVVGQEGPFRPGWSGDNSAGEAEGGLDVAVDAYAAYVAHIEGCGECGAQRCVVGQELVEVYLREVRRRR